MASRSRASTQASLPYWKIPRPETLPHELLQLELIGSMFTLSVYSILIPSSIRSQVDRKRKIFSESRMNWRSYDSLREPPWPFAM